MKKTIAVLCTLVCSLLVLLQTAFATSATVATSEDYRALGYPDGRKLVRDSAGNEYMAYRKKDSVSGLYQVYVSKSTNGGTTWADTNGGKPISTVTGGDHQRVPSIAIDSHNTLHVVWYGTDSTYNGTDERQIKYSNSTDGGATWTAWRNIAPVSGYSGQVYWEEHPVIYIDGTDNIYIVWEGQDSTYSTNQQTKFIKSTDGGATFTAWKNVYAGGTATNQSRPTIVVDSTGKIFVIAYGNYSGTQNIIVSTSTDGGSTFSNWSAVSASTFEQRHPSAAIDSGDKIHLVWREADSSGKTVIRYSKYISGAFSAPVSISPSAGYYQFFPSISNYSGNQYVVWTETTDASGYPSENPATGKVVYAVKLSGTTTWTKSDLTTYGTNAWASIRWSSHRMNGGTVDIVYSSGSASPYSLKYMTLP
ncbi:sialidase family protein [Paenibacillus cremeus]|nr:sialidase family protein [Paenibacillus cremeus]